ncbi:translation initiation factor IF-2 isoform X1 [Triticum aestivum]|uniref:translation initiation factor IF-2 isoform X1 n=1 Tax=Triticum aestivum TaxID=4565 RepID=UPI001D02C64A|nr:translation initiation factor IF-2-like isoform X1 [Triticum aestivum]
MSAPTAPLVFPSCFSTSLSHDLPLPLSVFAHRRPPWRRCSSPAVGCSSSASSARPRRRCRVCLPPLPAVPAAMRLVRLAGFFASPSPRLDRNQTSPAAASPESFPAPVPSRRACPASARARRPSASRACRPCLKSPLPRRALRLPRPLVSVREGNERLARVDLSPRQAAEPPEHLLQFVASDAAWSSSARFRPSPGDASAKFPVCFLCIERGQRPR